MLWPNKEPFYSCCLKELKPNLYNKFIAETELLRKPNHLADISFRSGIYPIFIIARGNGTTVSLRRYDVT